MAKKVKAPDRPAAEQAGIASPVRPFFAGFSVAAAWGAYNVPVPGTVAGYAVFAAKLAAAAILAGGAVAIGLEILSFGVLRVRLAMRGR